MSQMTSLCITELWGGTFIVNEVDAPLSSPMIVTVAFPDVPP